MVSSGANVVEGWVLSFAFDSFEEAGTVYERARDLVFRHDVDASVYRIVLNGRTHVVVLGFLSMPSAIGKRSETFSPQAATLCCLRKCCFYSRSVTPKSDNPA